MKMLCVFWIFLLTTSNLEACRLLLSAHQYSELKYAQEFLRAFDKEYAKWQQITSAVDWNIDANMNIEATRKIKDVLRNSTIWFEECREEAKKFRVPNLSAFERRQFQRISYAATPTAALEKEKSRLDGNISRIYSTAKVCLANGTCLQEGEAGIIALFATSRNPEVLQQGWLGWREATGGAYKKQWTRSMEIATEGANEHGWHDKGEFDRVTSYETKNLSEIVMKLYEEIKPLYRQLHAYVRFKLRAIYPRLVHLKKPLPAHLLGNPWAQYFSGIFPVVKPFHSGQSFDISEEMVRQKWTVHRMVRTAENLFLSLGFEEMTPKFWNRSIFVKPTDRSMECHAAAYDMSDGEDFRIRMCAQLDEDSLETIHHEMGHIVYYMSYRHLRSIFRAGANPGFHEAIGDIFELNMMATPYLHKIGLIRDSIATKYSESTMINHLMKVALKKVAFLPFALMVDTWLWGVSNGSIKPADYNSAWWRLRERFQGLSPPVPPLEAGFDAGAKYHVAFGFSYIRYFTSYLMQFQFYEAMCEAKGHPEYLPLHQCDLSGSTEAGALLKRVLEMGASEPWQRAMWKITGQTSIRSASLLRYFGPLEEWLKKFNCENNVPVGWHGYDEKTC